MTTASCRRALGALAFFSFAACAAGDPADQASTPPVHTRLVAAVDGVHAGERVLVGLEQQLQPHWHTYWINPGDTGVPTKITWDLPPGAEAGPIAWPAPARFRTGPVTNHGYEGRVTLLSTLTVPADARPGTSFAVHAHASWLVCKDVCIPQRADLALQLPVLAVGMPAGPGTLPASQGKSALPVDASGGIDASTDGHALALTLSGPAFTGEGLEELWFYPSQRGAVAPGAAQTPQVAAGRIVLQLRAGEQALPVGKRLDGVLVLKTRTPAGPAMRALHIDVPLAASAGPLPLPALEAAASETAPPRADTPALLPALVLALLGGAVLNLMPCVFPVLSIKALSLLRQAEEDAHTARLHGLAYLLGVLASFALLALMVIVLKAGGAQAGWGFQFQSPGFVLATALLMFAVGLNLSGVFEVGASLAGIGSSLAARAGLAGSFFTGVLATVVATPCTAPFMGGAVAFALAQPPAVLLAVFLSMGLGLALPYLLLSNWPGLQRRLPRPGAWMVQVRQVLAFPMYGAAAWLVWVLAQQAGVDAVPVALGGMVALAFAAWLYGGTRTARPGRRQAAGAAAALVAAAALAGGVLGVHAPTQAAAPVADTDWTPYSAERLQALRAQGQPVFVNLTASWCITCLVNERVALHQGVVTDAFRSAGITRLKGDWTNQDAAISALLARFGRGGVPLYVYYPAGADARPVVLPQLLTPDVVLAAIRAPGAALQAAR